MWFSVALHSVLDNFILLTCWIKTVVFVCVIHLQFTYSVPFLFYRSVWVAIVLVLNGYLVYNIYENILRYSQYPINSVVGVEYATSLVFPAVTICNYNRFRRSAINDEDVQFLRQLTAVEFGMFIQQIMSSCLGSCSCPCLLAAILMC